MRCAQLVLVLLPLGDQFVQEGKMRRRGRGGGEKERRGGGGGGRKGGERREAPRACEHCYISINTVGSHAKPQLRQSDESIVILVDTSKAALHWHEHQVKMERVRRRRVIGLVLGFLLIASLVSTTYYLLLR